MTPGNRRKEAEVKESTRFPSQMKPKNSNERNDQQNPGKTFNIIDIFLNNAKKMELSYEKPSNYPKNYENSPKNNVLTQIPGGYAEKSRYGNQQEPFSKSDKTHEEKSHHFNEKSHEERQMNYSVKSPYNEKSHHHEGKSGHYNENPHHFNEKSRYEIKFQQPPSIYTEKSRVGYYEPPKLDFQPILPENIENDNNYLYSRATDSSKLKEPRKDFSIFGKFITGNQPPKKKSTHQSISPYLREEKSIQKSRSSRFFEKNEGSQDAVSRQSARKTRNETLHNASASVLSNMDFKSFASNRPDFNNFGTRENTVY